MATIKSFEELNCWKKAREVNNQIYKITRYRDFSRDYELVKQIRKSTISIMSNIAEGFERDGNKEFVNFLSIAKGSAGEARAQLYIVRDQNYITEKEFRYLLEQLIENSRLISGLMRYLKNSGIKGRKFSQNKPET